jgi:arylamine N-acetyltransferase
MWRQVDKKKCVDFSEEYAHSTFRVEMLVYFYKSTRRHIQEDSHLHIHRH